VCIPFGLSHMENSDYQLWWRDRRELYHLAADQNRLVLQKFERDFCGFYLVQYICFYNFRASPVQAQAIPLGWPDQPGDVAFGPLAC